MKTWKYICCVFLVSFTALTFHLLWGSWLPYATRAKNDLRSVEDYLHLYYFKYKKMPQGLDEIPEFVNRNEDCIKDPWGGRILYRIHNGEVELRCETDKTFFRIVPLEDFYNNRDGLTKEYVEDYRKNRGRILERK
jgi:hypothetical protein